MQLAFSNTDSSLASDERIADLISAAESNLTGDRVRALFFANEALQLSESLSRPDAELRALRIIIDAMQGDGRTADATPYIVRAIDLAESISDREALDSLVMLLGQWAVEIERTPAGQRPGGRRRQEPSLTWVLSTIARLERSRPAVNSDLDTLDLPAEPLLTRRPDLGIEDPETGLLNARGMTVELLRIEDQQSNFAVIQVAVSDAFSNLFLDTARVTAELIGVNGVVARNGELMVTAILPGITGIAAMMLAEQLRAGIARLAAEQNATIGIGVSIKQPGDSSRDILRRVADRREEATFSGGVTVVG